MVRADTKAINVTECGSPFFPVDPTGKSRDSEASYECVSALESRYMLLFVVFTSAAALVIPAAVSGMRHRSSPSDEWVTSR